MFTAEQEKRYDELIEKPIMEMTLDEQNEFADLQEILNESDDGEKKLVKQGSSDEKTPNTDNVSDSGGATGKETSHAEQQKNLKLSYPGSGAKKRTADKDGGETEIVKQGSTDDGDVAKKDQKPRKPRPNDKQDGEKNIVLQGSSKLTAEDIELPQEATNLFAEDAFPQEFQEQAITMFKAAVCKVANEKLAELQESAQEILKNNASDVHEQLAEELSAHLEHNTEQWVKNNSKTIDASIQTQLMESFVTDLRGLFVKHQIEIPEDKVDILEKVHSELNESKQELTDSLKSNRELRKELNTLKREKSISTISEELKLTDKQESELVTFCEGIDYENSETFTKKVKMAAKTMFSNTDSKSKETGSNVMEEGIESPDASTELSETINEDTDETDDSMKSILESMKKLNKKY